MPYSLDTLPTKHPPEARPLPTADMQGTEAGAASRTVKCPRCQHQNRSAAKFREERATPLARARSCCGTELAPTAKFCPHAPTHLAEKILTSKSALELV